MSEEILKALMQLFAIIAKQDEVSIFEIQVWGGKWIWFLFWLWGEENRFSFGFNIFLSICSMDAQMYSYSNMFKLLHNQCWTSQDIIPWEEDEGHIDLLKSSFLMGQDLVERRFIMPLVSVSKSGRAKVHFLSRFSDTAWIANRKRIGARLSPCFTPEVDGNCAVASPDLAVITIVEYIFLITSIRVSGRPNLESSCHIISQWTESNAFTRSTKRT